MYNHILDYYITIENDLRLRQRYYQIKLEYGGYRAKNYKNKLKIVSKLLLIVYKKLDHYLTYKGKKE